MFAANDSLRSNSSLLSNSSEEATREKTYVKDLLKSRIFLGRYVERRLIDRQIGYRDIVIVSPAEVELKRDLTEAQQKLVQKFPNTFWIGIADSKQFGYSSSSICLWTEIENQPLGPFWFQIRSVKYRENEVMISLKCLRHISDAYLELEPLLTVASKKVHKDVVNQSEGKVQVNETLNEIKENLKSSFSVSNIKEFVTFLFAFIIAIFTGSSAFINFLGNFILALLRELSNLIKNGTPWYLGTLEFFSKIVGGFYILLAMFFKQSTPNPQNKRSIRYSRDQYENNFDSRYID